MIGMAMRPMALLAAMCLPLAAGFGAPALAGGIEVRPPAPPGGYALPRSASEVGDMDELQDALSERHAADIVLADGVYDHDSVLVPRAPHRLGRASGQGGAEDRHPLQDRAGGEVHGIRFDVNEKKRGNDGAIIKTHGSGHRLLVTDSWFEGNGAMSYAIQARAIHGVRLERLVIRGFRRDGIRITDHPHDRTPDPPVRLRDLDIADIRHPDPECRKGTTESGIWLGTRATVERVRVRNADWMCVIPISAAYDVVWRDLDLDGCPTGIYFEHYAERNLVERFRIGPDVRTGVVFEAGQARWHWKPVGPGNVIQDGVIDTTRIGVNVTYCTEDTTVRRVTFKAGASPRSPIPRRHPSASARRPRATPTASTTTTTAASPRVPPPSSSSTRKASAAASGAKGDG